MKLYRIYPHVILGRNSRLGPWSLIGEPPEGRSENTQPKTVIGDNALIRSHTVIYAGNRIGNNFRTGHHVLIREFNRIGDDVSIGSGCSIEHHVEIGRGVRLHSGVFIPEYSILEEGCWLGPGVILTNAKYPGSLAAKSKLKGPRIEKNARIGANVTLLPGVVVGANALVGAGAVITRNVGPGKVVIGNPGRIVTSVRRIPDYGPG
jgi:acetyltransferase-like isoleucine patch superfamily enzyme